MQHIPRLQPPNVMRRCKTMGNAGIETTDLLHDELRLQGLGVGDVDGATLTRRQLRQFLGQGVGSQVPGQSCEGTFAVAEGGFYDQCGQR